MMGDATTLVVIVMPTERVGIAAVIVTVETAVANAVTGAIGVVVSAESAVNEAIVPRLATTIATAEIAAAVVVVADVAIATKSAAHAVANARASDATNRMRRAIAARARDAAIAVTPIVAIPTVVSPTGATAMGIAGTAIAHRSPPMNPTVAVIRTAHRMTLEIA